MAFLQFLTLLAAAAAMATSPAPLTLARSRPVRHGVDGFPRIAAPADDAQRQFNRALDRLDLKVRDAARDCLSGGGTHAGDWSRQVDVPMRGLEFVSYLITDEVDCGGAHPNEGHSAIVYDLHSGAPVDWTTLLPRSLTGTLALAAGEDGVRVVTLASPRLFALYRAEYDCGPADADEKECRNVIREQGESGPVPMLAWLDTKENGLVMQFDLPHVEQACSEPVTIPAATLRREGASPRLLAALAEAHAASTKPNVRPSNLRGADR